VTSPPSIAVEGPGSLVDGAADRHLRIVHLFPDLLSVYGDTGNIRTLVVRAERRGIAVQLDRVLADSHAVPDADLFVIGGGQDRDQVAVEGALLRLGERLVRRVADGAALLAICGGYQSLGVSYRTGRDRTVRGPGLFDVRTAAGTRRLVGPVVGHLTDSSITTIRDTVIGFENHSGRTQLAGSARPLAMIEIGSGNNGRDGTEGLFAPPGTGGLRGLRIGTYLHGPLLPRNPHIGDALLAAALERTGQPSTLAALDDTAEWRAHDRFVERCRRRTWSDRLPSRLRTMVDPARNLIGF
jgi:CobQ-like glutamine amidotransferase family enzyme